MGSKDIRHTFLIHCLYICSGLDAFTAHKVVEILADLASNGKTVVLSIHQPRYTVFKLFDSLILMAEGEMVYQVRFTLPPPPKKTNFTYPPTHRLQHLIRKLENQPFLL